MTTSHQFGATRIFVITALFFLSVCLFGATPSDTIADTRGISVKARTPNGATRDIKLYRGYYALLVGCGDYRAGWPKLPNPVKDAREVATMLKGLGWQVEKLENPDGRSFSRSLHKLVAGPGRKKDIAIFFWFSGHGHTLEEADDTKLGYLVPVDAPDPDKDLSGFMNTAISMRMIETVSKQIKSKHVLMAFDSCFSGAIFQMVRAKPSPYIQEKVAWPVRQFITAGTEDEQVPDRSVFKDVFIQAIRDGFADVNGDTYITGEELGGYLQENVVNYTRKAQHPQFGKINNPKLDKGDFIFLTASSGAVLDTPSPQVNTQGRLSVTSNVVRAEVVVDGRYVGKTPLPGIGVKTGSHRVQVKKSGYETYRTTIKVAAGLSVSLEAYLTESGPETGCLYVNVTPSDARIRILNIVPKFYQGMDLSPGDYHVEVSSKDHGKQTRWVNLAAGEDKRISFRLASDERVIRPSSAVSPSTTTERSPITNSLGMQFVYIRPGIFMMGQSDAEKRSLIKQVGKEKYNKYYEDETRHQVSLTKGYYLQATEVTVGQWRKFVRATGHKSEAETGGGAYVYNGSKWEKKENAYWDNPGYSQDDRSPVTCVSWNDTQDFIKWLSREDGKSYRLPTEAEWEYAARAGTRTPFSFGECLSTDQANYDGNYPMDGCRKGRYRKKPVAVGSFPANAWGLHDMHGNVWEWCQDWYGDYPTGSVTDPGGPSSGESRVCRGGGWVNYARFCRSADRSRSTPGYRDYDLGLRLARTE